MPTFEGGLNTAGKSFAIIASQFNEYIVSSLVDGAIGTLKKHGVADDSITLVRVPGAFEIPPVAQKLTKSSKFDAVICLGVVIRGGTPHFDYVAGEAAKGIANAANTSDCPVIFGVLTTDTIEQAIERAGTKAGNKGADAAIAAIEMANLYKDLENL